jgi:uncharacterized protein (UPF0333 family)
MNMGFLRSVAFLLSMLALAAPAHAAVQPFTNVVVYNNALAAVALNASAGTRTITKILTVGIDQHPGYSKARLVIAYTWAAATTVTVAFSCSIDGTNYGPLMVRTVSGSTATVTALTDSYTTGGASATMMLEYDLRGCAAAKWLLGGASAGASDLVTADLALVTGA